VTTTTNTTAATGERVATGRHVEDFLGALRATFGTGLIGVVRFGSTVAGEALKGQSDTNLLVIVDALPLSLLHAKAGAVKQWVDAGYTAPLFLTDEEWRTSADVFAMEYADVLHRHEVLHGRLPLEGIRVAPGDLRLGVEREAMGKLLQLRRAILAVGATAEAQRRLLGNGLSTLMVIFRGAMRVAGEEPSQDYEALSTRLADVAGFDAAPFHALVAHVRGARALPDAEVAGVLSGVLTGLERLVAWLDGARAPAA
jgi:hypothetical protein